MKSILVATDFSPHSQYTLQYVLDLFKATQGSTRILLVNTYLVCLSYGHQSLVQLNDELKSESQTKLEIQKREALEWVRNPHVSIETTSHMGSLPNVISNLIKKEKIDLVAIGKNTGKHVDSISSLLEEHQCPLLITYLVE